MQTRVTTTKELKMKESAAKTTFSEPIIVKLKRSNRRSKSAKGVAYKKIVPSSKWNNPAGLLSIISGFWRNDLNTGHIASS